jgi:ABC-2 type transport system permease protein
MSVGRSPGTVVARRTARASVRSGAVWGYVFGAFVASSALTYPSLYKTQAQRDHLAAIFGANKAASAMFGPAPQLQTVAGFTVFKTSMTLMVLGAVWGLLASTRLLRGEEDSGRWELVLAGQTTPRGATAQALAGLGAGAGALWAITALFTVLTGLSSKVHIGVGAGLFFALALVASAVMWLATGALTSQLAATRRQAAGCAAVLLGASYALRMVADSGTGLHWLVWASPLGWVEQLQPLTSPRPLALLPIAGLTAVLAGAAAHLAGRRDLGGSTVPDRATASARLGLLSGTLGLAARLARPVATAWLVAIAASALMMGVVAKAAGATIAGTSVQQAFTKLGAAGTGTSAYLGVTFLMLAVLVAFVAAGQVTSARSEEAAGRLDHLMALPVARASWLAGRLLVAFVVVVVSGLVAGASAWLGAASQSSGVSLPTLLDAGLNVAPPALCTLGIGVLAIGTWPRGASATVYGVLAWSLLVEVLGATSGTGAVGHWLLDTSVFHQMATVPAAAPNWGASTAMVAIGAASALAGTACLRGRDLKGE